MNQLGFHCVHGEEKAQDTQNALLSDVTHTPQTMLLLLQSHQTEKLGDSPQDDLTICE